MSNNPTCEICGDVVARPVNATECGHVVHLCETCKRQCPGALKLCVGCEDGEYDDEPQETRGPMHDADDAAFDRWAERYDKLNGGPENDDDR